VWIAILILWLIFAVLLAGASAVSQGGGV